MDKQKSIEKRKVFDPERTKQLQKDWQSYGKGQVYYGLFAPLVIIAAVLWQIFLA